MSTIEIFDGEHGQCSLVTSSIGERMLIDCGHNTSSGWRPSTHLRDLGVGWLEQLVITNYDEDHASDLVAIRRQVGIAVLVRNPTVQGADLYKLKSFGGIGQGIAALAEMVGGYDAPVANRTVFDGMTMSLFWNEYPTDFVDENNLSLVTILRWQRLSICFGGDMEMAGWRRLLQRSDFVAAMDGITIFVASHHGRRNGYCADIFERTRLRPEIVIISDSGIQYASQETVALYRKHASGFLYQGNRRHVLTTRHDGKITIDMLTGDLHTEC